jgi:glutathione S-transferase
MWAIGRVGPRKRALRRWGTFGKNREPAYLNMNPNGLVPTLQDGDFILWESNSIIRYLARGHDRGKLEGTSPEMTALANQWMDWQLTVLGPAITPAFHGLIRTPEEKRDLAAIAASQTKTTEAMKILDAQLGKTSHVAGEPVHHKAHSGRRDGVSLLAASAAAPRLAAPATLVQEPCSSATHSARRWKPFR